MQSRGTYVFIGVLVGIIVMQWAMPLARGQDVEGTGFTLRDGDGNITAMLFQGEEGPVLGIGEAGRPKILINAPTGDGGGAAAILIDNGENWIRIAVGNEASILVATVIGGITVTRSDFAGDQADLAVTDGGGGQVSTSEDGTITGTLPSTPTALKPTTWGMLKMDEAGQLAGASGSASRAAKALSMQTDRVVAEYSARIASMR